MKTCLYCYILFLVLITTQRPCAQICHDTVVHLNENGNYTLDPFLILDPDVDPEFEPIIHPDYFTCDHLGENIVDVYLLFNEDTIFSCFSRVQILENAPPDAACISSYHVILTPEGQYNFTFEELDDGTSNVCDQFFYRIEPPGISCGDPNPASIKLIVKDQSEQFDTCTILVSWEEDPTPTIPIECPAFDTIHVLEGDFYEDLEYLITSDSILIGGPYACPQLYFTQIGQGGDFLPFPIIKQEDIGETFQARVSDLQTGDQCFTELFIAGIPGCDVTFNLCDTKCKGTPLGDCGSGHTDTDDIEWPCDIVLTEVCPINWTVPTPEELEWYPPEMATNAWPEFSTFECEEPSLIGYYDPEIEETSPTSRRIRREWTVLNWILQEAWTFNQYIDIFFDVTEVCDTKPWDTPFGDCDSGHTIDDDVEWPADITVESIYYLPDDLENNPDVVIQNARPQINTKCNLASVAFQDEVSEVNDTTVLVERVWSVTDSVTGAVSTYTQLIQAKKFPDGSLVCITNGEGTPIADVALVPGINTDSSGCYAFADPDGIIVVPRKDTPLEEGVNLLDIILLLEEILDQTTLTEYQRLAADINHNFGVSTLDYVQMRKILLGSVQPPIPKTWRFYQPLTYEQEADISNPDLPYPFFGIKTGDVDYSYYAQIPDYEDRFIKAEDEILNKGETYRIPFHLNEFGLHTGMAVRILNPNQNLEFLNVTAPDLPNFEGWSSFHIQPGVVTLVWVGRGMDLPEGYPIYPEDTLFVLELKANENVILNEELTIDVTYDNLISAAHGLDPYDLRFEWEDIIISSTASIGDDRHLLFYPNPFEDKVYINGLNPEDTGKVLIHDATGRWIQTSTLQPVIDLPNLTEGLYFVSIRMDDGSTAVTSLMKTK